MMTVARAILFVIAAGVILVGCANNQSARLGVNDGRLTACPDSPNCVSSQSSDQGHMVEPIVFHGNSVNAFAKLKNVILSMNRARIVEETDTYLHVEFRSAVFRFVDDVEFLLDEEKSVIDVRSASRVGYWDVGVNRRRVEAIRNRFYATANPSDVE